MQEAYVGVTDYDWYRFLAARPDLDEVNFWQPSGSTVFRALQSGEPFLFKLHIPYHVIVGGGFFVHWTPLPVGLAWEIFEQKNGTSNLEEMLQRLEKYVHRKKLLAETHEVGCIVLAQPFFFPEASWISVPSDWKLNIVRGKGYSLNSEPGRSLWRQIQQRLQGIELPSGESVIRDGTGQRFGAPQTVLPRLGQGAFRVLVTDAYQRRCAVTGERVLPTLEAAHIRPFAQNGPNSINNGILMRSDLHRLFDHGYITVDETFQLDVSKAIRERFKNGREYYDLRSRQLNVPTSVADHPSKEFLAWHNREVFLG